MKEAMRMGYTEAFKMHVVREVEDGKKITGARNYYTCAWITSADGRVCFRLQSGGNNGFVLDPKQDRKNIERNF